MARKFTPLTPEQRAEKVAAAKAKLDVQIEGLMSPEGWEGFITSRRWLRKYSLNNQMLILSQCEHASDVRSFTDWKAVGRSVRKGEKGLAIFAPVIVRDQETDERKLVNFKVVYVFDVSQTDGEPVFHPQRVDAELLSGDAPALLWERVEKLIKAEGYTVSFADLGRTNGITRFDRRTVEVNIDRTPAQQAKTLIHELAHIRANHEYRSEPTSRMEVEAESIAQIVCDVAGLDSLPYSVGYVSGWARDFDEVKEAAETVTKVADSIIADLDLIEG